MSQEEDKQQVNDNSEKQLLSSLFGDDEESDDEEDNLFHQNISNQDQEAVKQQDEDSDKMQVEETVQHQSSRHSNERQKLGSNAIEINVSNYPSPISDSEKYLIRLTGGVSIQPESYVSHSYTGEDLNAKVITSENGEDIQIDPPTDVIRWRWARNKKGERVRQSNAKLVKWSDGSIYLYVGKECYAVSTSTSYVPFEVMVKQSSSVIQSHGPVYNKAIFRPINQKKLKRNYSSLSKRKSSQLNDIIDEGALLRAKSDKVFKIQNPSYKNLEKRQSLEYNELSEDFLEEGFSTSRSLKRNYETTDLEKKRAKDLLKAKESYRNEYEEDDFVVNDDEELSEEDLMDEDI